MSTITFRGAFLRYADLRIKDESGVFTRLHLTAYMSDPVIAALGWEKPPDCADSIKLSGALVSRTLVLTPNQSELRSHEIEMECSEVSDFQFVRIKGSEDEAPSSELRFIARSSEPCAIAKLENYLRLVGQSKGALKVRYEDQQKLDLAGEQAQREQDEAPNCPECADGVELMPNDDAMHVSGQPCRKWQEAPVKEAPLASAASLGGTHQKRGRRPQLAEVQ